MLSILYLPAYGWPLHQNVSHLRARIPVSVFTALSPRLCLSLSKDSERIRWSLHESTGLLPAPASSPLFLLTCLSAYFCLPLHSVSSSSAPPFPSIKWPQCGMSVGSFLLLPLHVFERLWSITMVGTSRDRKVVQCSSWPQTVTVW